MDIITLNNKILEILDKHELGYIQQFKWDKVYGPPEMPVYSDLMHFFDDNYTDILKSIEKNYTALQNIEINENINIDLQEKTSLLLQKVPFLQFPPIQRHYDGLNTREDKHGTFTSIFQITDTFIAGCAARRPLMEQGRVLILPRGFGWRLPVKDESPLMNLLKYDKESIDRFPEGGLGAILNDYDTGAIRNQLINPTSYGQSIIVSSDSWSDFINALGSTELILGNLNIDIPIIHDINVVEFNRLINEEKDAFINCSIALKRVYKEITESKNDIGDVSADGIVKDILIPEINKIENAYKNYQKYHSIKIGAIALATVPIIICALSAPQTIDLAIKTIGSGGILTLLSKEYVEYLKSMAKLRENDWYFIWKGNRKIK